MSVTRVGGNDERPEIAIEIQAEVRHFDVHHFDRDDVEAFILTYRMLTQRNDRYSIAKLGEGYEATNLTIRNTFNDLRERKKIFLSADSNLKILETTITYGEILDTVIYVELAHSTEKKEVKFTEWTRWPAHEQAVWVVFDHALRYSMQLLQQFRDLNALALMTHFGVLPDEKIFKRLQDQGVISPGVTLPASK